MTCRLPKKIIDPFHTSASKRTKYDVYCNSGGITAQLCPLQAGRKEATPDYAMCTLLISPSRQDHITGVVAA